MTAVREVFFRVPAWSRPRRIAPMTYPDLAPWFDSPADSYDELPPAEEMPSYDE
jgi:hypothetical protein